MRKLERPALPRYVLISLSAFIGTFVLIGSIYVIYLLLVNLGLLVTAGLGLAAVVALSIGFVPFLLRRRASDARYRALTLSSIDQMDGILFEHYIAKLLQHKGFRTLVTKASGDLGVDIIAQNHVKKYAVQVKRQSQPVSRRSVSDAVTGKIYYGCNAAMVVTNSFFTPGALELAHATGCELVNRDVLARWIAEFQKS